MPWTSGSIRNILDSEVDASAGAIKVSIASSERKAIVAHDSSCPYHLQIVLACEVEATLDAKVMHLDIVLLKVCLSLVVNVAIGAVVMKLD